MFVVVLLMIIYTNYQKKKSFDFGIKPYLMLLKDLNKNTKIFNDTKKMMVSQVVVLVEVNVGTCVRF